MQNVDFFRLCQNFTFEVQKTFFSIQNIKKECFFLAFLLKKKLITKRSIFLPKPWTNPFAKCRFFSVFWNCSFLSKKHSFLSRIWKNVSFCYFLLKQNIWEKGLFFDKNNGLTPFQNFDFLEFFRTSLFRSKKHSLLSRISKNLSFWLFLLKKKRYEKKVDFLTKTID